MTDAGSSTPNKPAQPSVKPVPTGDANSSTGVAAPKIAATGSKPAITGANPEAVSSAPATQAKAEVQVKTPAEAAHNNVDINLPMLEKLVAYAQNDRLSDIHIHSDEPIALRVSGEIEMQKNDFISRADITNFIDSILSEEEKAQYKKQMDLDMAIQSGDMRFRVNIYNSMRGPCMVLRKIEGNAPDIEQLNLPKAVFDITTEKNGLVLVTGPTGSGKSTTLASIVKKINQTRPENIITIEDPIEFVHHSITALMSQREIGKDAATFASALKASLREDPDVILLGEMRDLETVSLALTAAETGHLVFGTLHTNGAPSSVNRILDVFPPAQQAQARSQLSQSLRLVVTQRLIKRCDKPGRCAAFEVMVCNTAISNLIRENKIFQIEQAMQTGKNLGMMTMQDSVKDLIAKGMISREEVSDMDLSY